ncbi:beta-mannosidase [Arthrobacter sp. AG258]|uniref:glycoside hydrolase family 2 protein n=1 Tax=Arthrobacter sp. AG258 TaxID=2183899 RepID=UPI00105BCB52|nr:glycoside hydrolase family 2 TIM barrel-domain containing protein [Arthrobacter sp. AG258]TDT74655.1 beta-mannosidase [Arthrobacter sp. AG258]
MTSTTHSTTQAALERRSLSTGWNVRVVDGPAPREFTGLSIPTTVPGSVHTDLLAAGLIPDPYLDDNERLLAWIGQCDWEYSLDFPWHRTDKTVTELVFQGLDTVATISLNGVLLDETRNMHRSYSYDVRALLSEGINTLKVTFRSAIKYADQASLDLGYRPHVNHHPYNAIRKMACSFGWDWGIDTSTAGIWKDVYLQEWSTARIQAVRPVLDVQGTTGTATVFVQLDGEAGQEVQVQARLSDQTLTAQATTGTGEVKLEFAVGNVRKWAPHTHGEAHLYELHVELLVGEEAADAWSSRVGFRTVEVRTPKDEHGTAMFFEVNGERVFVRGVNWIPDDAFPHRVTRERLRERLTQAKKANINLIRIWGGGIYESDDFYELCDELGLMVWQDFLFACAAYSEEEPLRGEVEAEARGNILRLMTHPSLALWNGNNENIWGYADWKWQTRLQGKSWGAGYYYDLLPSLVSELDPGRPYTPGSPFSPDPEDAPNDPSHGSMHIWDLWNEKDYPHYRDYSPRFVAEFGWQAPPNWSTLTGSLSDAPLTPESPGMIVHQKAMLGNDKLNDGLVNHFELPNNMTDWHWAMQLNQANAIKTGLEHMRHLSPHCMGAVVWQLNDCWPVTSWAAVDGYGREKPLLFAIQSSYADRILTVQPRGTGLVLSAVNDAGTAWNGELRIQRLDFAGRVLREERQEVSVEARGNLLVDIPAALSTPGAAENELVAVTLDGARALWFFAEYRDSELVEPRLGHTLEWIDAGYELTVTAQDLTRDLSLLIDKVDPDARVDTMLLDLLPGESAVFRISTSAEMTLSELVDPLVLRSANQLVAAGRAASAQQTVKGS